MKISANILLSPSENTLGSLRDFLKEVEVFNLEPSTELFDGGHVQVNDDPPLMEEYALTLEGLTTFVNKYENLPNETVVSYLTDLCVEPEIFSTETIGCGEHIGCLPENIVVTINPACSSE